MNEMAQFQAMRELPSAACAAKVEADQLVLKPILKKLEGFTDWKKGAISKTKEYIRRNVTEKEIYRQKSHILALTNIFENNAELAQQTLKRAHEKFIKYHPDGSAIQNEQNITFEERSNDVLQWAHLYGNLDGNEAVSPSIFESNATYRISDRKYFAGKDMNDAELAGIMAKEGMQTVLSAYLFAQNRHIYERKAGTLDHFDKQKELRQMEGVVRALDGQHGQFATSEGKTSVILPITTLVEGYTNQGHTVYFSSDSTLRTKEYVKFAQPLAESLKQVGIGEVAFETTKPPKEFDEKRGRDLHARMEREALFNGEYSEETRKELKKYHWQRYFEQQLEQNSKVEEEKNNPAKKNVKIHLTTHDDLMHAWMQNESMFTDTHVPVFMDEAHAPFDRGTPYQLTSESLAIAPEQIQRSACEWVMNYVVSHYMNENDVAMVDAKGSLSEQGREKLQQVTFKNMESNKHILSSLYRDAIKEIGEAYGITNDTQLDVLRSKLTSDLHSFFAKTEDLSKKNSVQSYVLSIGETISQMYYEKEESFTQDENGHLVIRDAYQDELLASHEYSREYALAVQGLTGKYKTNIPKRSAGSAKFPSLIHALQGRVVCFSGTLADTDEKTGKITKSPFATFLEDETKRNIHLSESPNRKHIPSPNLEPTTDKATRALIDAMNIDTRGGLIIDSTTIEHALQTFEMFKEKYGEDKVVFIGSKPTGNEVEEEKYAQKVERYTQDLAEGKIQFLVSTGSIGIGMNIVKKNGEYPDIKIGILGMPKSRQQLKQIIGRRRAPDSAGKQDYFWHIGEDQLEKYISMYLPDLPPGEYYIGPDSPANRDQKAKRKQILEAKEDPEKMKEIIFDIAKHLHLKSMPNTVYDIEYDRLYKDVSSMGQKYLKGKVCEQYFKKSETELSVKERVILELLTGELGMPADLYADMPRQLMLFGGADQSNFSFSAKFRHSEEVEKLKKIVVNNSYIEQEMDRWMHESYTGTQDYYQTTMDEAIQSQFKEGYSRGIMVYPIQVAQLNPTASYATFTNTTCPPSVSLAIGYFDHNPNVNNLYAFNTAGVTSKLFSLTGAHPILAPIGPELSLEQFPINMTNGVQVMVLSVKNT